MDVDDAPHHEPEDDLAAQPLGQEPGERRRRWWEWLLIVLGIIVLAVGGLCVVILISLNQMY